MPSWKHSREYTQQTHDINTTTVSRNRASNKPNCFTVRKWSASILRYLVRFFFLVLFCVCSFSGSCLALTPFWDPSFFSSRPLFSQAKLAKPSVSGPRPFSHSSDELQMFGIFPSKSFCLLPSSLLLEKPSQVHLIKASPRSKAPLSHNQSLKVVVGSQLYERPPKILQPLCKKPCSLPHSSSAIPFHLLQDHFYADVQAKTPPLSGPITSSCQLLNFASY